MPLLSCVKGTAAPRFRLVQDDSRHWYAIPADQRELFDAWVESFEDMSDEEAYEGPDFNTYRLGFYPSNYTFTNLQEDK